MTHADELYYSKIKDAGHSNTAARYAVFNTLYACGHEPISMKTLVDRIGTQADRASVYRSVKLLEEIGIVNRVQFGWKYKLELSDDFHGHHHHITCTNCGATHATHDDDSFEATLHALAAKHGYTMTDHQLDIRGLCPDCQYK